GLLRGGVARNKPVHEHRAVNVFLVFEDPIQQRPGEIRALGDVLERRLCKAEVEETTAGFQQHLSATGAGLLVGHRSGHRYTVTSDASVVNVSRGGLLGKTLSCLVDSGAVECYESTYDPSANLFHERAATAPECSRLPSGSAASVRPLRA